MATWVRFNGVAMQGPWAITTDGLLLHWLSSAAAFSGRSSRRTALNSSTRSSTLWAGRSRTRRRTTTPCRTGLPTPSPCCTSCRRTSSQLRGGPTTLESARQPGLPPPRMLACVYHHPAARRHAMEFFRLQAPSMCLRLVIGKKQQISVSCENYRTPRCR